ncbi:MATE family multidrug resistance protein [Caulobacter ginsengisoli]|uniref:Multidrug-efflux transporter n=1 Tax=Caulobacter ginsengisoli TaxID=400775 RepID=A0ABU0IMX7_9CAUL|nr:MATE family efflux transporter [Caulobacter ginsengisoli]MDQ0463359.1 MATE family multidrug resistance protein [Caulobacter ginsengisoli]
MTDLILDQKTIRPPWLIEAKALARLAGPMALAQLAQMAILTTDVLLIGRFSEEALASVTIGNAVYYFAWLIGNGPASAVSPMVAQILGARPRDRAHVRAAVRMSLWTAVLISIPMLAVLLNARWILLHLGQQPELAKGAGVFVAVLCFGLPFTMGFQVLRNFTAALGKPGAALWVMLASIVFNAIVGWTLIFGHFGFPRLGLVGSGIATAGSAVFAFFAMLVVIWLTPSVRAYRIFRRFHIPVRPKFVEVLRLGLPMGLAMIFEAMLFNTMTLVMGSFGMTPVAAHQITLNVASITFMIPLGIGMAATVRVGLAAGRNDMVGARRAGFTAAVMATGFAAVCGLIMALFGRQIASLYVGVPEIIELTATLLIVAAAFQVFDSLQVVGVLSLRGLKDARASMILAGVSYWLAGAPVSIGLGVLLGWRGLGVWIGLAFGLAVAAAAMGARFMWLTRRTA